MRVIVSGSRSWDRPEPLWTVLDIIAEEAAKVGDDEMVVVHGAAFPRRRNPDGRFPLESADYLADLWCRRGGHPLPVRADRWPADWTANKKTAGLARNRQMVDAGADVVLAFHRDNSPGTRHCIGVAERAGLPVQVFQYAELAEGAADASP